MLIKLSNKVSRGKDGYSSAVRKTIDFLNNSIEVSVSMNEISRIAGVSSSHLSRKFKSEVGISPYEYLINLRMHLASRLLKMTPITIKQISETLCYADAYYFSNAFKKHYGLSPQHFRNIKRKSVEKILS
jgi:iron complex transport system substrate-binding protein